MRSLIKEDMKTRLYKEDLEMWKSGKSNKEAEDSKDVENDNIEQAEVWTLKQKQSFKNIEMGSFSSLEQLENPTSNK